jgi:glycosyltransferase involved in cell wall biosynthesis
VRVATEERPKLLVITSIDTTLVVLLWAQLRAFLVAGYDVRVACQAGANREWLESQGVGYEWFDIRRSISPWADMRTLVSLVRYLRRERVTIVHTHTPKAALLGQLAARIAGVPVIVNTVHGFYFHDEMPRLRRWFYILLACVGGRCADMTLSQNSEDIATAVRLGICRSERIRYLGNGIDLWRFDGERFGAARRAEIREAVGLPDGKLVIGMIGRLVVDKGYLELFEAVRSLWSKRKDFRLVMIGPEEVSRAGRMRGDTYRAYGIEGCTVYLGPRDDVPELMSVMDVFVLPSWREGFPRSAIEAAAMGLPIVTTDVRGCREVVRDGENGLLIPVRDAGALESAIGRMLDDAAVRDRMGLAGRRRAMESFDERAVCGRVLACYEALLLKKGLRGPAVRADLEGVLPRRGSFVWCEEGS